MVGSSNFTKRGLGGSDRPNLEINLATDDRHTLAELLEWFNRLWNDRRLTEDVKQRVLDALERSGGDYAPEAVYYKTLHELFRKDIEARLAREAAAASTGFTGSQIWNALYEFQKDGAQSGGINLANFNWRNYDLVVMTSPTISATTADSAIAACWMRLSSRAQKPGC